MPVTREEKLEDELELALLTMESIIESCNAKQFSSDERLHDVLTSLANYIEIVTHLRLDTDGRLPSALEKFKAEIEAAGYSVGTRNPHHYPAEGEWN